MRKIDTSDGHVILIDDEDYRIVSVHRWHCHVVPSGTRYARMHQFGFMYLHILLMGKHERYPEIQVDHINGDGLDNRRKNLRWATPRQNLANRPAKRGSSSRFKGVGKIKDTDLWRAQISVNGKNVWIGRFETERAAALAYNAIAKTTFGEFAYLNQVDDG